MKNSHPRIHAAAQRGLTLIEFMISVVIGMLMIAAIATLIANQSTNRAEVDRAGKLIENGRFAIQSISLDAQLAGFWGEYYQAPGSGTTTLDPCNKTVAADVANDTYEHIQGYDSTAAAFPSCISNRRAGTDVLVIRRADTDASDAETAGTIDWSKLKAGQFYVQTGLDSTTSLMKATVGLATGVAATDQATFTLKKKDKTTIATPRKLHVHIYYISACSVEVAGSCTGADGGTPIPTLKRVELTNSGGSAAFTTTTIAEGIENMQVDYGLDVNADGAPDTYIGASSIDTDAKCQALLVSASATKATCWASVMTARVYLLARASDKTPGFTDTKSYSLGTYGTASAAAGETGYRRHVFTQTIKLVNPSGRASS